jgi:hypothetical protein
VSWVPMASFEYISCKCYKITHCEVCY